MNSTNATNATDATKAIKAYGIVVNNELKAVFLEEFYANRDVQYYKHLGNPSVIALEALQRPFAVEAMV